MIYEMRTYDLHPYSLREFELSFGEAYKRRMRLSKMAAFFHTVIGPLNQIIHIWPYNDLEERNRIRAEAVEDGGWPADNAHLIKKMRAEIMIPLAIMPEIVPMNVGPYFEICTETYATGELPKIIAAWEKSIDVRLQFGPVCALWYSELGGLNKFQHIWPYRSLDQRQEIQEKLKPSGLWPIYGRNENDRAYRLESLESKIVMPSTFSPLT
jgi:NIPSNAP protein